MLCNSRRELSKFTGRLATEAAGGRELIKAAAALDEEHLLSKIVTPGGAGGRRWRSHRHQILRTPRCLLWLLRDSWLPFTIDSALLTPIAAAALDSLPLTFRRSAYRYYPSQNSSHPRISAFGAVYGGVGSASGSLPHAQGGKQILMTRRVAH